MRNSASSGSLFLNTPEKYYPPPVDPARHLFRETLIRNILGQIKQNRLIFIEAQAGQGKSILLSQVVSRLRDSAAWYQIGFEDQDPVSFFTSIIICLKNFLPTFSSHLLRGMIEKGEIKADEYPDYIDLLCADIAKALKKETVFVFDDLHLLENSAKSMDFLFFFMKQAPPRMRFILASRYPVLMKPHYYNACFKSIVVNNAQLSFSEEEVFLLFNDLLQIKVSRSDARVLQRGTEGWIMGLLMTSYGIKHDGADHSKQIMSGLVDNINARTFLDYFSKEILPRLDENIKMVLLRVSLLDKIPLVLAEHVTGNRKIAVELTRLTDRNFFIRRLDYDGTEFAVHHLFREALRIEAIKVLSGDERKRIHKTAGEFYAAKKATEEALRYFISAEDYAAVNVLLEKEGMLLCELNRHELLRLILDKIPEDVIHEHGWLSLFRGIVLLENNPPDAFQHLQRARNLFTGGRHAIGRLYALSKILHYHLYVDAKFNLGLPVLEELEKIFARFRNKLVDYQVISVAYVLASANSFIQTDFHRARKYCDLALSLASKMELQNTMAELYREKAWSYFSDWHSYGRIIEESNYLKSIAVISAFNKMMLRTCALNLVEMEGDFDNYFHQETQLTAVIESNLIAKTYVGSFMLVWQIDIAVARGEYEKASSLVLQALRNNAPAHTHCQYLHYQALLFALSGDVHGAQIVADEALSIRYELGGKVFIAISEVIIGSAYALLGLKHKSKKMLLKAVTDSKAMGEEYLRTGAYAALAYLDLSSNGKMAAEFAAACLASLKKNAYKHFFGWCPAIMKPVLQYAVLNGIEEQYARMLLAERFGVAVLPEGEFLPLMKIKTFGDVSLSLEDVTLRSEKLTPAMRELLSLLVSSPNMAIYQEEILAAMWPDMPEVKARGSLDTLLLKLRKVLQDGLGNVRVDHYLTLKKGVLGLRHAHLDATVFTDCVRKGLAHSAKKEFWRAGNQFFLASRQWQGVYFDGLTGKDKVNGRRRALEHLGNEMTLAWAKILTQENRHEESISILTKALSFDETNDLLISKLYQAYLNGNQPVHANNLLKRYEDALKLADYSPGEIQDALKAMRETSISRQDVRC